MTTPEVSSASEASQSQQPETEATQQAASGVPANLTGIATMAELEIKAKPVAEAIKFAIASNICSASTRSNERIKETLREGSRSRA